MAFPSCRQDLEKAGFSFEVEGRCRGKDCRAVIHWWRTPKGRRIPLNPDCTLHFSTCRNQADFR
jgi:hypothetical protein